MALETRNAEPLPAIELTVTATVTEPEAVMAFKDSRLGPGTLKLDAHEFNTQAAAVRLTPSVDSEDGTPTLAVPQPAPLSTVSWALNIDAIQDFEEAAGLVNYLMDNALSEAPFEWTPLHRRRDLVRRHRPDSADGDRRRRRRADRDLGRAAVGRRADPDRRRRDGTTSSSKDKARVIRLSGTIEYTDGARSGFETGTAALAEWELYALRHGYPIGDGRAADARDALVVAHTALGAGRVRHVAQERARRRARDRRGGPYPAGSVPPNDARARRSRSAGHWTRCRELDDGELATLVEVLQERHGR